MTGPISVFGSLAKDSTLTDGSQVVQPWAHDGIHDLPTAHPMYLTVKGLRKSFARVGSGLAASQLYDLFVSSPASVYTVGANRRGYILGVTIAATDKAKFDIRKRVGGAESSLNHVLEIPTGGGTVFTPLPAPLELGAGDVLTLQIFNRSAATIEWSYHLHVVEL